MSKFQFLATFRTIPQTLITKFNQKHHENQTSIQKKGPKQNNRGKREIISYILFTIRCRASGWSWVLQSPAGGSPPASPGPAALQLPPSISERNPRFRLWRLENENNKRENENEKMSPENENREVFS